MKILRFIFVLFSFSLCAQTPEEQRFLDTLKMGGAYLKGRSMPDFKVTSTEEIMYSRENLNGKITFINLWFEACSPCIAEMGALNDLYSRFKNDTNFQFLSFTFEKKEDVKRLAKKYKIKYPIVSTTMELCYTLNFRKAFPTLIVLDNTGKVAYLTFGGNTDPKKIKTFFETKIYPVLNELLTFK